MTAVEILKKARGLISKPETWTYGVSARDRVGRWVGPLSDPACRWCATGALWRAADGKRGWYVQACGLLSVTIMQQRNWSIAEFNDRSTHGQVLGIFDQAIQQAESETP